MYLNNKTVKLLYKNRNKINNKIETINRSDGEQLKKVSPVDLCSPYTCTQLTYNIPQTYTPAKHEQQSRAPNCHHENSSQKLVEHMRSLKERTNKENIDESRVKPYIGCFCYVSKEPSPQCFKVVGINYFSLLVGQIFHLIWTCLTETVWLRITLLIL